MTPIYILLALSPLALIVVLLLVFRKPLVAAAPITLLYTAALVVGVWHIETVYAQGAVAKGALVALDILLIIFGAIFFLQFLKRTGVIESIEEYLCSISPDHRIQVILLAWFFLSFIEGMSGFGTPMALVAPLLVGIGFPAVLAVTLALVGVGTSVAFGAVGTPIRVGLAGLPVTQVPFYAALINMIVGVLIPVFLVIILIRARKEQSKHAVKEILPFAVWSGACLTVPYFLASFLGKEFPSLIGPFIGAIIAIYTIKKGWFVPKNVWRLTPLRKAKQTKVDMWRILIPYLVFVVVLLIGKFFFGSHLLTLAPALQHRIEFFNPIIAFIAGALAFSLVYRVHGSVLSAAAQEATHSLVKPLVVIFCISTFVQLMIVSGHNGSGLQSMLALMTGWLTTPLLPLIAPFVGTLGAFISGSATVSNLLFANLQYKAAQALSINDQVILAQQTIGGGVGNTVSLTDITVVEATVQLHGEENHILKAVFWPVFIYVTLVGIIGLLLVYVL
jgi:lactate permease